MYIIYTWYITRSNPNLMKILFNIITLIPLAQDNTATRHFYVKHSANTIGKQKFQIYNRVTYLLSRKYFTGATIPLRYEAQKKLAERRRQRARVARGPKRRRSRWALGDTIGRNLPLISRRQLTTCLCALISVLTSF